MKKTFKNIIVCICIVYFVLSILNTVVFKGYYEEVIDGYDEVYIWINSVQEYKSIDLTKEYVEGQLNILNNNINIIIVSIILGFMIGLLTSQKENSIVRYIVVLILGYLSYCVLWTFITMLVNKSVSDVISNNFVQIYYDTFFKMFASYIMFYIAGLIGVIFKNKIKVKSLNETLKNPNNQEKSEKIFKIIKKVIIVFVATIVVIFIGNTIRKTVILTKYSEKINEISNSDNYYVKEEAEHNYMESNVREIYYKDGVFIDKDKYNDSILYSNENTKENLAYYLNTNVIYNLKDDFYADVYKVRSRYWNGNNIRRWGSLLLSFNIDIYSEECNGKDCYVIEKHGDKSYIDKETYLEVRRVEISDNEALKRGEEVNESIYDYTYEFGNVTDEDIKKPDMTGFSLHSVEKDK